MSISNQIKSIHDFTKVYFIGVAGVGMSAIAQYLVGIGKSVSGSDRYFDQGKALDIKSQLEQEGIVCHPQDGSGISENTDVVVVSTAIEDTVLEVRIAKERNIPIIHRSALLSIIADSKKTIAVSGTSGKSTTSAMLYHILEYAGLSPSIISGAGLTSLIKQGKIGNAAVGMGEWLVIEADESDGSIVQYKPDIGLLLNIDKDHNELDELIDIFTAFKNNSKYFISNRSHSLSATISQDIRHDFSTSPMSDVRIFSHDFAQEGFKIHFKIDKMSFNMNAIGRHTMENATAAVACAMYCGAMIEQCSEALSSYEGIYRRHQILGKKRGIWVIDDYGHNPVKCAASIAACQPLASRVFAWFQPHGYGPTKFLKDDFISELSAVLRADDEMIMSEIFYAGGTAVKDISANDLIEGIKNMGKQAAFIENRNDLLTYIKPKLKDGDVMLLMGARDPSLDDFSKEIYNSL